MKTEPLTLLISPLMDQTPDEIASNIIRQAYPTLGFELLALQDPRLAQAVDEVASALSNRGLLVSRDEATDVLKIQMPGADESLPIHVRVAMLELPCAS